MKRLLCIALALLLLAGCAGRIPDNTLPETTAAPTEPAVPWIDTASKPWDRTGVLREMIVTVPGGTQYNNAMEFNGDLLLWSVDNHLEKVYKLEMCLVELDDGTVRASREFSFAQFTSPQILGDVLYLCDGASGTVLTLNTDLEVLRSATFPACVGDFYMGGREILYIYNWEGSVRCLDLNSGSESTLLPQMNIDIFHGNERYVNIEYTDGEIGQRRMAVLDLETGEILEPPVPGRYNEVALFEGTWLCQTYGEQGTAYVGTCAEDFRMTRIGLKYLQLLDENILVVTGEEGDTLSMYDRGGNLLTQAVLSELPYVYSCTELIRSDVFGGYFMVITDHSGSLRLLYWDVNLGQQGENLVFEPIPQPGDAEKAVLKKAEDLSRTYGLNILVGENCDTVFFDFEAEPVTDWNTVSQALDVLEEALEVYPEGFFRQLRYDSIRSVEIHLTGTITATNSEYVDTYEAFVQEEYDKHTMAVDILTCRKETYYHEFSHIIDAYLAWDASNRETALFSEEVWNDLNPGWFPGYTWDYSWERDVWDYSCFIDSYSTIKPSEDRARVLEYAMAEFGAYQFDSGTVLLSKLDYYCRCIRDAFDTTGWPDLVLWEQYLP